MKRWYPLWALAVLGWLGWACLFGFTFTGTDEVKSVPRSVRSNPGSYRSHYQYHYRTHTGK
ncbi:MAG: hypothetical protein HYZ75_17355 [Elusimicrobia bacterium]|nr:hypothetical protein [Elusimicrobiota bacterium]